MTLQVAEGFTVKLSFCNVESQDKHFNLQSKFDLEITENELAKNALIHQSFCIFSYFLLFHSVMQLKTLN